jgi:hypothetical protein
MVPFILRARVALFAFILIFLIPILSQSLRGLTHILVCNRDAETPFTLIIPESGEPLMTSSTRLERESDTNACKGLDLNLGARSEGENRIAITVPIRNRTSYGWQGSVRLTLADASVPVGIGEIPPEQTRSDTVVFDLPRGSHELEGSLLLGP